MKQKLPAPQRAGLKTIFIPSRNEPDLDDVPELVLAEFDLRPESEVKDILASAFASSAAVARASIDGTQTAA